MVKDLVKQVIKASGVFEEFKSDKIYRSIWLAAQNVGGKDENIAVTLKEEVLELLSQKFPNGEMIKTSEIGELVEKVLINADAKPKNL
jgi:transcriptional regulator NrdR family protein